MNRIERRIRRVIRRSRHYRCNEVFSINDADSSFSRCRDEVNAQVIRDAFDKMIARGELEPVGDRHYRAPNIVRRLLTSRWDLTDRGFKV